MNEPAFPEWHPSKECHYADKGMALRDYFAAKAMASCGFITKPYDNTAETAKNCYKMADAMMEARKKK